MLELVFATALGCILSFLCGAGVVYGRDYLTAPHGEEEKEPDEKELKMRAQWAELLDYDGEEG